MSVGIFLLLMSICMGTIYLIHKYFGKEQFYLLGIIYSILSFVMSFKIINILGVSINANVIFSSGLILILYYFVSRYNEKESRKFILSILSSSLMYMLFFMLTVFMMPSIYDKMSIFYQTLILDNLPIVILYPISTAITLFFSEYCFKELKNEEKNKFIKLVLTIFGIIFIDTAIFAYFSYAFIIKFDSAVFIAIDNYLFKTIIMIFGIFIINKLFTVKKVK